LECNKPWRAISSNVLTSTFLSVLEGMGWQYHPGKGCRHEWKIADVSRVVAEEALAA
jgi:hypothetical protein